VIQRRMSPAYPTTDDSIDDGPGAGTDNTDTNTPLARDASVSGRFVGHHYDLVISKTSNECSCW
jgi:hypothetical protein